MCNNRNYWKAKWGGSEGDINSFKCKARKPGNIIGFLVRAFILKILWNILVPAIFGGPVIGFLHAVGLLILGKIITGGPKAHCGNGKGREWKAKMKKKMENMNPEERKAFKEKMLDWEVNIIEVEDDEADESEKGDSEEDKKK